MAGKTKYDGILKRTEPAQSEPIEEMQAAPEPTPMPAPVQPPCQRRHADREGRRSRSPSRKTRT